MKCYFCGREIDSRYSQYPPLNECFNCGKPICSPCAGSTEKIAGDIRGVFCPYCKMVRDWEVVPIHRDKLVQWADSIGFLIDDIQSNDIKETLNDLINDIRRKVPESDEDN